MIKHIIFDLDDTIVDSSEELAIYYKEALEKLGYDSSKYLEVYHAIDEYEVTFSEDKNKYSKKDMLNVINNVMNENYSIELIDEINRVIGEYWINKILLEKDVLEYLYDKYKLYVFSNWFYEAQYERLKNIDYLKYFKKILTADNYGSKPYLNAYKNILTEINANADECVMIGDSLRSDVCGAINAGFKAIWFNPKDKKNELIDKSNFIEIMDLKELRKLL